MERRNGSAAIAASVCIAAIVSACRPAQPPEGCERPPANLDAASLTDGIYGVDPKSADPVRLATFADMKLLARGADPSGTPWIQVHLDEGAARAMQNFTAEPAGRSIAVIVGGKVACAHGIRSQLKGDDLGVSCCNPSACDVWASLVRHEGEGAAP